MGDTGSQADPNNSKHLILIHAGVWEAQVLGNICISKLESIF